MLTGKEDTGMEKTAVKLALTLAAIALLALATSGVLDRAGFEYTERSFKRALVTFAVARGLNAVISVAQGTAIAVEPAGVGVNFTPGQVLDPINDLVEQFSWVMLASATALGLQRLLLELFTVPVFTWALAAVWLGALVLLWLPRVAPQMQVWLLRLGIMLLVLRFAVPLLAMTGELFYGAFLQERHDSSSLRIEQVTSSIHDINQGAEQDIPVVDDPSLVDRVRRAYQSAAAAVDVGSYLRKYERAATDVSEQVVNLIVVFLVQTVVLPLLFLWGLLRGIGWLWRLPLPAARQRESGGDPAGGLG